MPDIYEGLDDRQREAVKHGDTPLLVLAGPGSGKCVLPGSRIVINNRLSTAEQAWEEYATEPVREDDGWFCRPHRRMLVDSFNDVTGKFELAEVTGLYRQFVQEPIREIRFAGGASVSITRRHQLYTGLTWTNEVEDQTLSLPRKLLQRNGLVDLDLAELLGWIVSEGYERGGTISISQGSVSALARMRDLAGLLMLRNGITSCVLSIRPSGHQDGVSVLEFSSAAFREYLLSAGHVFGVLSAGRRVPSCIMNAGEAGVRRFLRALFDGDGWVEQNRASIGYCSASRELVEEVQHLLCRFGVWSRTSMKLKCATNGSRIKRPYYYLAVSGPSLRVFASVVGFGVPEKQAAVEACAKKVCNPNRDLLPSIGVIAEAAHVAGLGSKRLVGHSEYDQVKNMSRAFYARARLRLLDVIDRGVRSDRWHGPKRLPEDAVRALSLAVERLDRLAHNDLVYDEVEEVVERDYEGWVYDFSVDRTHSFVANGVVCHNTRMLTHRVAHLVQARGIHPRNILVTTFTNKAAQEMEDRLEKLIEAAAWELNIGTTHSLCSRIIRQYGPERVGLKRNFTTYDADDQRGVIGDVVLALVKERVNRTDFKTGEIVRAISFAKDCGIGPDYWPPATPGNPPAMRELYVEYDRRLRQANAADFGDLQVLAVRLLEQNLDVLAKVRERFQYVLVDEFQDVNPIQAELFYLLCEGHRHLTVVGDTNQCIPRGEKVLTPRGLVSIEKLEEGQFVLAVSGKQVRPAKVKKVWMSRHERVLEFRTASGRGLRCTPNHVVYASQSVKVGGYYVYLMWKPGVGYRIGSTSGGLLEGKQHLTRVNIEHAERMWALGHETSKSAARYAELRLSLRYGIPTVPFVRRQDERLSEQDRLRLFREFSGGEKLLAAYGLSFDRPMYMSKATQRGRIAINVGQAADVRGTLVSVESDHLPKSFLRKWLCHSGKRGVKRLRRLCRSYKAALELARQILADLPSGEAYISERLGIGRSPASTRPIEAEQLRVGMNVVVPDGSGGVKHEKIVSRRERKGNFECFDLEVENVANYFVGGICVHNSVYAFRSATPKFALQFGQDWKDGTIVKLERNYRSTKSIVRASNAVVENNINRYKMTCYTENPEGEPLRVMALATPEDEATRAAYLLSRHHGNGVPWSQMAILYRLHRSSRVYESALIGNSIPYHLHGSIAFFDREEIKDILAWMRVCVNPADVESFKRACGSVPLRMGKATVGRVIEFADAQKIPVLEAAARSTEIDGLAAGARSACRGFVDLIGKLTEKIDADGLVGVIVDEINYRMTLNKREDAQARAENLRELGEAYGRYHEQVVAAGGTGRSAVELFLAEAVLHSSRDKTSDGVWVGSVHAAKGTEFDVVLVVDCEDGIFPHAFSISNPRAPEGLPEPEDDPLEEERRLWYVAITRARKAVYLLWARTRMMLVRSQADNRAFMANQQSAPSPFLAETRAGGAVDVRFGDFTVPKI